MLTAVVLIALASSASCFNKEVDEKFRKLPRNEFVKYFNSQNFTYKITHYDTVDIDKRAVHCTTPSENGPVPVPVPATSNNDFNIGKFAPKEFDGRISWGHCYRMLADHGECAACWAVATATVAEIRSCLIAYPRPIPMPIPKLNPHAEINSPFMYPLSPFDLTCCKDCYNQTFCGEGSPDKAALFWLKHGIVTELCKPYAQSLHENDTSCKEECFNDGLYYHADKHFGRSVNILVQNDHEIRREIFYWGPVVASFYLYEDFKDYKEGIYEHTHGSMIGVHTVAVIGYGVENGVPYWLAHNTWGPTWGQLGVFKVKRYAENLVFEHRLLSLFPRGLY